MDDKSTAVALPLNEVDLLIHILRCVHAQRVYSIKILFLGFRNHVTVEH